MATYFYLVSVCILKKQLTHTPSRAVTAHCWPGLNLDMTLSCAGLTATDEIYSESVCNLKFYNLIPLGLNECT